MARARNIKPGFFTNDQLVELSFETRLLFIGLWTIADKAGRLLDRPKKIKMELFPADSVDVAPMLDDLAKAGFIRRYTVGDESCIEVNNWAKHQSPHHTERDSTLPAQLDNVPLTVKQPSDLRGNPPDSGFTDSGFTDSLIGEHPPANAVVKKKAKPRSSFPEDFSPNDVGLNAALGLDVAVELEAFRNHHVGKGNLMADWQATWRTWCGNARKFAKPSSEPAWRKEQRERTQQAAPGVAAKPATEFFMEQNNVTPILLG